MGKSQEFKATVNFGAKVDPSFGAAVSAIGDGLTGAAKDAAYEVNKLSKQQEKLRKRIEEANKAGKDVSKLTARYDELSSSIETASKKLSRLNAVGKTLTMAGNIGRFGMAGGRLGMAVARPAVGAGVLAGGLLTGAIGTAIAANAETAMQLGKAQGYGLDFGTHMAYQGISKAIGLDEDAMGDLLDEMKNKIGEVGNEKMLNPLLAQIGLTKTTANKMMKEDPNELFKETMTRLNAEVKAGRMSAAEAGSFADQLFGGEAQKIVSYMTTLGMSLEDLEANARKYNLVTEEGAKQAVKGQYALSSLWGVVTSGFQEIVGRTLGAASNDILAGADALKTKLEAATPDIIKAVTDWMAPDESGKTGPQKLWDTVTDVADELVRFGKVVAAVVDHLGWLIPDEREKPEVVGSEFEARALGKEQGMEEADKLGLGVFSAERRKLIRERMDEYGNRWSVAHGSSAYGQYVQGDSNGYIQEIPMPATYTPKITTNNNNVAPVMNFYMQSGDSVEDISREVSNTMDNLLKPQGGAFTYD